jgi:predicted RNA-binding protein YlxR (DUF448 family)
VARKRVRRKHIPYRTCVACRTTRPKRALIRVVRTPEGEVMVDPRGKHPGRGAYICAQRSCWTAALARRRLEAALKTALDPDTVDTLRAYSEALPETLEETDEAVHQGGD